MLSAAGSIATTGAPSARSRAASSRKFDDRLVGLGNSGKDKRRTTMQLWQEICRAAWELPNSTSFLWAIAARKPSHVDGRDKRAVTDRADG